MSQDLRVKTSERSWSEECRLADAKDALDTAQPGLTALAARQLPPAYEFSNGRRFMYPKDPYK